MDPVMSYPVPEGEGVIHFYKDLDRTLESIAHLAPEDVSNYRDFVEFWGRINKGVLNTFLKPPTGRNILTELARGQLSEGSLFGERSTLDGLKQVFSSYGDVVDEAFENPYMKTALVWFAAQSGPLPDHPATGDFAGWQSMLHQSGAKRPRGGSGMLTQALAAYLEDHGGKVKAGAPVQDIIIEGGRARGVRTSTGEEYRADVVVSNAHVQTTMLNMVGREHLDGSLIKKVDNIRVGNGFGMVIRCAVDKLPRYKSCPDDPDIHNGMQLLVPSMQYMNEAIGDYRKGRPPEKPCVLAMTFTEIDPELAPPDKHLLYAWAQWHPYSMQGGLEWDDIREKEAQKIYDVVTGYAPNMDGKLIDWYIQTPLDIERKHGMPKGNVMHVEMSFDQMFMFRPLPEMSDYRTPVKNLYLSSASCHPGGGVFGAAGYNAAQVILKDMRKRKWF